MVVVLFVYDKCNLRKTYTMKFNKEYVSSLTDKQLEEHRDRLEGFLNGVSHAYWEDRADNIVGPNPREAELTLIETELDKRFEMKV